VGKKSAGARRSAAAQTMQTVLTSIPPFCFE